MIDMRAGRRTGAARMGWYLSAAIAALTANSLCVGTAMADDADREAKRGEIVVTGALPDDYVIGDQSTSTRLNLTVRETPQAMTVITRAQIEDFNLNSINDVLLMTPGVNVERAETDRTYYNARGFDIVNFQYDGIGQPLSYGLQTGSVDTALFERVEVVRGSTGLLSLTGNPSAAVNFVRKRPGTETGGHASLSYSAFDTVRGDVDVNAALNENGSLRARFVGAYEEGDSHLDFYHNSRLVLYGVVAADLGPDTTATVGYSWQNSDPRGVTWGGVPFLDAEGNMVTYSRSTTTAQPWSRWETIDRDLFGDITHDFGRGWQGKISVLRRARDQDAKLFYLYGAQDPETGEGLFSWPGAYIDEDRQTTVDAHVSGTLKVGGREHDVVLGANYGEAQIFEYEAGDPSLTYLPLTAEQAFGGEFPYPDFGDYSLEADFKTKIYGAYGLLRLSLADPVKLMLGGTVTRMEREGTSYGTDNYFAKTTFSPFAGLTLDLTRHLTAYASYATIFNPQIQADEQGRILDPVEGKTYEAGLKGEWNGGKLTAGIAVFKTEQDSLAEYAGFSTVTGKDYYRAVNNNSRGVEVDVAGEVLPGLQVTGGYAYVDVEDDDGNDARTFIPNHTIRFSAVYSPPSFDALRLGASARYQSRITNGDAYQDAYAVVDLMARYELTRNLSLAVNLDNVGNAKYWQSLQWAQGIYSAPRTVRGTVGVSF